MVKLHYFPYVSCGYEYQLVLGNRHMLVFIPNWLMYGWMVIFSHVKDVLTKNVTCSLTPLNNLYCNIQFGIIKYL